MMQKFFILILGGKEKDTETGRDISSTFIREMLVKGDMEKVNALLGYPFFLNGMIVHGRHLGHSLGFPTINQNPPQEKALPPFGVYAARVTVNGQTYAGVANVGVKPTVSSDAPGVETHLIGFDGDLYGEEADVRLLSFLRPERKFQDLASLSAQIETDRKTVLERNVIG